MTYVLHNLTVTHLTTADYNNISTSQLDSNAPYHSFKSLAQQEHCSKIHTKCDFFLQNAQTTAISFDAKRFMSGIYLHSSDVIFYRCHCVSLRSKSVFILLKAWNQDNVWYQILNGRLLPTASVATFTSEAFTPTSLATPLSPYTLSGNIGKVVASYDKSCRVDSRHRLNLFIQCTMLSGGTAHEGGGCHQSIRSTVFDAIIRSLFWSTTTSSCPSGYFSSITLSSW